MTPIQVHLAMISAVSEDQRQRLEELYEQQLAIQPARITRRQRLMLTGGKVLISLGNRLEQSAGMLPQLDELDAPCVAC